LEHAVERHRSQLARGICGDQTPGVRRARALPGRRKSRAYIVFMERDCALQSISDDELLRRLGALIRDSRRVESELVAHIAELCGGRTYVA
jgi:hypothetical protein